MSAETVAAATSAARAGSAAPSGPGGRRVLFVANSLAIGGAERQLVNAACGLADRGHDVHVAALLDWVGLQPQLAAHGIPVHQLRIVRPVRAATALCSARQVVRRVRPDVLVAFDFQANLLARLVGHHLGVAVISSIRGARFGGPAREAWIRVTDRWSYRTTANSEAVAADLVRRGLVAAERIAVVPNLVDTTRTPRPGARERVRDELGVPASTVLFVALGHVVPAKDHATLVRALGRVPSEIPLLVAVAGKVYDSERAELEELAASLGVSHRLRLLGHRRDVPDLLAAADALVSSSRSEGSPNAVMEAHGAGLPVVATRVGGTGELVLDGVSGRLVPACDPDALGHGLVEVATATEAVRWSMGAAGYDHVVRRGDPTVVLDQWERLVVDAADPRRRARTGAR